jgi:hypothetical protein
MRSFPLRVVILCAVLAAASLACSVGLGGPTPPASPIAVSSEAAGQLEDIITQAVGNSQNGEVTVVVTEEQLTSYFALKAAEDPDAPLKDIQIFLRDGQIVLHGNASLQGMTAPAEIRLNVATNAEGGLDVSVADANFGPMPVPQSMLDTLSAGLDEALSGQFGPQATGVRVTNVVVSDGQMTLTGSPNP